MSKFYIILGLSGLNGKGHAITTLVIATIVAKIMIPLGVGQFFGTLFVFGSFITCHSANVWGISAFSPDADLIVGRIIGVRIHRKWYFHSFLLSLPMFWAGAHYIGLNASLSAFLFGMAFGWNAHVIEDDLWSRVKHHKKQPFPLWVEATSLLFMTLSVIGVVANFNPQYYTFFAVSYKTVGLGFIPETFGFVMGSP